MYAEIVDKGIATLKTSEKHHEPRLICHKRKVSENKKELKKRQKFDNVSNSAKKYGKKGKAYPPVNRRHPPKCLIDSKKKGKASGCGDDEIADDEDGGEDEEDEEDGDS
ncbi:hypothetical protein Tco_1460376 [Tanacetum coccineum]